LLTGSLQDERPIFVQLAELVEDAILSGAYAEEDQVPSITEISVAYKINPATALKGINLLVDDGLLYKKRGLGMFVSRGAREKLTQRRRERFYHDFFLPMLSEANRLGVGRTELMQLMERGYQDEH